MPFGNVALPEREKLGQSCGRGGHHPKKLTRRGGNKRAPVALNCQEKRGVRQHQVRRGHHTMSIVEKNVASRALVVPLRLHGPRISAGVAAPLHVPLSRSKTAAQPRHSWIKRVFRRQEPTLYQRCLAVHVHFAGPNSALTR
jgi:hypothetical protein